MKKGYMGLRLDPETEAWVRDTARETGKTLADVMTEALTLYRYLRTSDRATNLEYDQPKY